MMLMYFLYDGTHACIVGEKKRTKEKNVGLDFSMSFENWLNL